MAGGLWEGRTLYDLYNEAHTPWEWQAAIKEECEKLGMDFLSSVFDPSAIDFLDTLGVEMYKNCFSGACRYSFDSLCGI